MLRQTVEWAVMTAPTGRDGPVLAEPTTVPCRKVAKLRDVITPDGDTVTATTSVMMTVEPTIGDTLDGREVIVVESLVDVPGNSVGWTAFTR